MTERLHRKRTSPKASRPGETIEKDKPWGYRSLPPTHKVAHPRFRNA